MLNIRHWWQILSICFFGSIGEMKDQTKEWGGEKCASLY